MKIAYMQLGRARAAANSWPDWLDKEEHPELLYVTNKGEERVTLPARATKVLLPDRQELCSYNAGFRIHVEEVEYSSLVEFFADVRVRANDNARQAILIAEPTKQTRKRPSATIVRRVHDQGDGEGSPLTGDIQTEALIIDIDSGRVPGLDVADPIPAVRAALTKLDPQFAHVGMVVQLTAKQDPYTDEFLRGRVYAELARPIHRRQQQWWQRRMAARAPELKIDTGIMDSARVVYIAPPILVAEKSGEALLSPDAFPANDPLEGRRWFFDGGPGVEPPAELPNVNDIRIMHRAASTGAGSGYAGNFPYLPEGDELSDFDQAEELHPSIIAATFWLVVRGGKPDQVAHDVTNYIRNLATGPLRERLNREPGRLAGIEKEVLDAARGAAEKYTSDRQLVRGVLPWCPRPRELSPEEGVEAVRQIVGDVVSGQRGRVMLAGAAGIGKSYEAAKAVAATRKRVDVYNPTHDLIREQVGVFERAGCTDIAVLSGRKLSECVKAEAIGTVVSDQYPLTTAQLCGGKDAENPCPRFQDCRYIKERIQANPATKTVFRATPYLSHDPSWLEENFETDTGKPELVIVDEDFVGSAVSVLSVRMAELRRAGLLGEVFHYALLMHNQGAPLLDAIETCFHAQRAIWCSSPIPTPLSWEEGRVVTEDTSLDEVVETQWQHLKKQRHLGTASASMDGDELMSAVEKAPGGYAYYELIRGLRRCFLDGHGIWNGADEFNGEAKVIVRRRLARLRRRNQSVLMINATADPLITEALLPNTEFVNICVRRNAYVIQVYDHTFSYKWLSDAPARLQDVGAFIRLHAKFMKPGVGYPKDRLGDMFNTDGLTGVTFGKERGINELEDCDVGFVVSRVQPSATACEEIARGLWPHEELELTGEFIRFPMGYNTRDGRTVGTMGWAHRDRYVNSVLISIREGGLEQMLDRFRLIHNPDPKLVYVFTNQPFNVVVDELATLDEAIGPARLMRLVEEYDPGPLPLSPKQLAQRHPDLFKGTSGAAKFCSQVRKWVLQNAWRVPLVLEQGAVPPRGGRRVTLIRLRGTPIVVNAEHYRRARA